MGLPNELSSVPSSGYDGVLSKLFFYNNPIVCAMFSFYTQCEFFLMIIVACSYTWNQIEQRIATLEFDRDRKSMGVIVSSSSGKKLLVKVGFFSPFNALLLYNIKDLELRASGSIYLFFVSGSSFNYVLLTSPPLEKVKKIKGFVLLFDFDIIYSTT